jgi:hypothetical protein
MHAAQTLIVAACCLAGTATYAQQEQGWLAAPDSTLESMRGGFALAPDFMVSFGITRTVLIDGNVIARTAIQIDDLRNMTVAQAKQLTQEVGGFAVVQNGPGNTVNVPGQVAQPLTGTQPAGNTSRTTLAQPTASAPSVSLVQPTIQLIPGLVIQNTESNRHLQAVTEINAATNGMRILQGINLNQTLNDALKGALGR